MNRPVSGFKFLALTFALLSLFGPDYRRGLRPGHQRRHNGLSNGCLRSRRSRRYSGSYAHRHRAEDYRQDREHLGDYRFGELAVGTYTLTVTAPNFKTVDRGKYSRRT